MQLDKVFTIRTQKNKNIPYANRNKYYAAQGYLRYVINTYYYTSKLKN